MATRLSKRERKHRRRELKDSQVRELLKPEPVQYGIAPQWFLDRLFAAFGRPGETADQLPELLSRAFACADDMPNLCVSDWGLINNNGCEAFVMEVDDILVDPFDFLILQKTAIHCLKCSCRLSANAYTHPGRTIRIRFEKAERSY